MHATVLKQFGFLSITGKDAITFLQGYATCDLDHLSPDRAGLGAICNLQGRMLVSFRVIKLNDGLLLRIHRDLVDKTRLFLGKYIVFSKAEMSDMSEIYTCYGAMTEAPNMQLPQVNDLAMKDGNIVIKVSDSGPRFEIWAQQEIKSTDSAFTAQHWQKAEIDDGFAWVDGTSSEEHIPQMFNYHNIDGIDFEKGCYLGQEIIARLEFRGKLKRKLHRGGTASQVSSGNALVSDAGKPLGAIVNVAHINNHYSILAVLQNTGTDAINASLESGESILFSPVVQEPG
ncbi:MAG: folate-binding protein YgfZ [Proteobacteria bacterium]|nr:folate-binding protein YgfZ [Pseudomonadota bacterium]